MFARKLEKGYSKQRPLLGTYFNVSNEKLKISKNYAVSYPQLIYMQSVLQCRYQFVEITDINQLTKKQKLS